MNLSNKDYRLLQYIIGRVVVLLCAEPWLTSTKDIVVLYKAIKLCHEKTPIRLSELLQTNDIDFKHDIWLIGEYLDRDTGILRNNTELTFKLKSS